LSRVPTSGKRAAPASGPRRLRPTHPPATLASARPSLGRPPASASGQRYSGWPALPALQAGGRACPLHLAGPPTTEAAPMAWMAMLVRRKSTSLSLRNRTAERRGLSLSPSEASSSSVCRRTLRQRDRCTDRCTGASGGFATATRSAMAVASGVAVVTMAGVTRPWTTRATANIGAVLASKFELSDI
jgi:hypothetical protein